MDSASVFGGNRAQEVCLLLESVLCSPTPRRLRVWVCFWQMLSGARLCLHSSCLCGCSCRRREKRKRTLERGLFARGLECANLLLAAAAILCCHGECSAGRVVLVEGGRDVERLFTTKHRYQGCFANCQWSEKCSLGCANAEVLCLLLSFELYRQGLIRSKSVQIPHKGTSHKRLIDIELRPIASTYSLDKGFNLEIKETNLWQVGDFDSH